MTIRNKPLWINRYKTTRYDSKLFLGITFRLEHCLGSKPGSKRHDDRFWLFKESNQDSNGMIRNTRSDK